MSQRTWNDSATACQNVGAQLVVIKSDEEQVCLMGLSPHLELPPATGWGKEVFGWIQCSRIEAACLKRGDDRLQMMSEHLQKGALQGWREGSVGSAFARQAWEPEFGPLKPTQSPA